MADGRLRHTASTDILFPEPPEEPPPPYQEHPIYSPGSARSAYSVQEAKFVFPRPLPRVPPHGAHKFPAYETHLRQVAEGSASSGCQGNGQGAEEIYSQPVTNWSQRNGHQHQDPGITTVKAAVSQHPPDSGHGAAAALPSPSVAAAISRYNYLASLKRRTWSPPTFERVMGAASSMHAMRSYRSNDQLDMDTGENHYEDLDSVTGPAGPPRIAPVSGRLAKSPHKALIKPIAFKPIVPPHSRYVSTPHHSPASSQHSQPLSPRQPFSHRQPLSSGQQPYSPPQRHHSHDGHYSPAVAGAARRPYTSEHVSPPQRQHSYDVSMRTGGHSQDDGYISQEYGQSAGHSHSNSNASQGSNQLDTSDRSISYMSQSDFNNQSQHSHRSDRPESFTSSNLSRVSSHPGDAYMQTPSPSDSGVGELEAMLRDKDAEIQKLRETMEKNETAILQVYKERKENYEMEIREINAEWDRRMRFQQQKAFKTEQGLLMQLFKIQQERKTLRLSCDQARMERDAQQIKCSESNAEAQTLKAKMEELQWEMCQKSGEISLFKLQLKEAKDEVSSRSNDLIGLRAQVRELHQDKDAAHTLRREKDALMRDMQAAMLELERARSDLKSVESDHAKCGNNNNDLSESEQYASKHEDLEKLRIEMEKVKVDLEQSKSEFEQEREQWLDEKNKVIRYQKHLQLNYVQMYRKNKMLEAEVEQLTLELESRDIQLSSDGNLNEEESMC